MTGGARRFARGSPRARMATDDSGADTATPASRPGRTAIPSCWRTSPGRTVSRRSACSRPQIMPASAARASGTAHQPSRRPTKNSKQVEQPEEQRPDGHAEHRAQRRAVPADGPASRAVRRAWRNMARTARKMRYSSRSEQQRADRGSRHSESARSRTGPQDHRGFQAGSRGANPAGQHCHRRRRPFWLRPWVFCPSALATRRRNIALPPAFA